MNLFEIPVTARPQTFTVALSGILYTIRQWWLKPAQCWMFDIMDIGGAKIACGIPLITGADLLDQLQYIGLKGWLFVISDELPPETVPDFTHLGVTGHVYFRPLV